ncbi:hypothetical protein [Methanococcoides seepicolus]|uniref:Uncharacterized protein n=1 Tax=Methanococcoides seepicolus TaxID=2828780 RepID=A0A9E5DBB3_9EURY|nr:hypothetical protein [Methanococcoides seepicolus]MCM1986936.1 hypothetical protein [Methanococcoides seepicolus]
MTINVIIAGQRKSNNEGFICSLSSRKNFDKPLVLLPGGFYFAGSNTKLVQQIALDVYSEQNPKDIFKLDTWAVESMYRIAQQDDSVEFPCQLVGLIGNKLVDSKNIEYTNFLHDRFFESHV